MANRSQTTRHSELVAELRNARIADWRKRARSRPIPDHVHGTLNGYSNYACRCEFCKAVKSAANRGEYRKQRNGST